MTPQKEGAGMFGFGIYEIQKTLKGLAIALLGAGLAYFSTNVLPMLENSPYMTAAIMSAIVNMAQLWLRNNENKE